ncbi:hypothetical protein [Streptomyces sp. NPDC046821]|uniref:hypothetical protein n=1 Tax=Streptomyces sp. NPDC046821 TaxID=3154702 RepID=UPI0034083617
MKTAMAGGHMSTPGGAPAWGHCGRRNASVSSVVGVVGVEEFCAVCEAGFGDRYGRDARAAGGKGEGRCGEAGSGGDQGGKAADVGSGVGQLVAEAV